METTDSFREFVIGHWPSDEVQWFKKLGELGWVGADWPLAFGGHGLDTTGAGELDYGTVGASMSADT